MPNNPYASKRPPFDEALFADYERANRAAARQCADMPSAFRRAQVDNLGVVHTCLHCPRKTRSIGRVCRKCRKADAR